MKKKLLLFIAVILIIAAVKNPSRPNAIQMVKAYTIEKVNQKIYDNMNEGEEDSAAQVGQFFGSIFVSKIVEKVIDVDVTDYIILSSFRITAFGNKNIASGVILFGNIIPLASDIKNENFQEHLHEQ